jgi:hypothetical protein
MEDRNSIAALRKGILGGQKNRRRIPGRIACTIVPSRALAAQRMKVTPPAKSAARPRRQVQAAALGGGEGVLR